MPFSKLLNGMDSAIEHYLATIDCRTDHSLAVIRFGTLCNIGATDG